MPPRHRPRTSEGRSGHRSDAKPAPCRIPVAGQYHQGGAKRGNDRPTRRDSASVRPPSSSATIGRRPPVRPPSAPRRRAGRTRQCTLTTTRTEPRSISATLYRGGPSTAYESPGDPGSRGDRPESHPVRPAAAIRVHRHLTVCGPGWRPVPLAAPRPTPQRDSHRALRDPLGTRSSDTTRTIGRCLILSELPAMSSS